MYIADLHIHSRYSRATSRECTPEYLDLWARRKGIHLLGTGDFTHPAWRQELEEKLIPAEEGLYRLKEELRPGEWAPKAAAPRFVISGEISSIYKKNGRVRKVHNVILLPGLHEAGLLSRKLETIGNIHSDGRPILGLDSRDLLEITLEICPRAIFVPAHIWTPHFSMFGAFSGFDTMEECFEDLTPHIRAFETGLSSDPPMNWRLSALDRMQMISNSDAHSPAKLGREANLLDISMSYDGLYGAVQEGIGLNGTIEFFPEEGKYHYDGHRKCHLCLSPREAKRYQGRCPVCGKKLTLGVSHRIEQLADREEGFVRSGGAAFESLVPLPEVIAASMGSSEASKKVQRQYQEMLRVLGTEFEILRERSTEEIQREAGYFIAEGIRRLRAGKVQRFPGFDGEYGTIKLFEPSELESMDGQMTMFGWTDMGADAASKKGQDPATEAKPQQPEEDVTAQGCGTAQSGSGEDSGRVSAPTKADLNEEQLQAVTSIAPRIAVIAGPGTGKTKTLVSRILYLLQNRRVRSSEITAVTFTNQAAQEMRNRLEQELGGKRAAKNLRIGTFHSICHELLRAAGREFILVDEETATELVREILEELGIKRRPKTVRQAISVRKCMAGEAEERTDRKSGEVSEAAEEKTGEAGRASEATWDGESGETSESVRTGKPGRTEEERDTDGRLSQADTERILARYQQRLAEMSALDFDDLLLEALKLAEGGVKGFSYLLADEFQDISPLQYRLIQAWAGGGREVFIIGDPNQAIYGFRGADCKSFRRFCQEERAHIIRLKNNYRSTPEILRAAGGILRDEETPLKPVLESGLPVRLTEARGDMAEAIFVAKEINRLMGGLDMVDAHEGFACPDERKPRSFADIAVLYRTHRQSALLELCLKKEGIPYIVTGREEFLEERTVRGSLAFFRSISDSRDQLAKNLCLKLLWNAGAAEKSVCEYETLAEKYTVLVRRGKPQNIWSSWIEDMELGEDQAMEKLRDMAVFYKTMEEMLRALAFGRESDLKRCGEKSYTSDAVTLMTVHGSKGLEFPAVFVCGLKDGTVPLRTPGRDTDMEEERRLLYVALTRAKEELIMTASGELSPFLVELPEGTAERQHTRQKAEDWGGRQMSLFEFMSQ